MIDYDRRHGYRGPEAFVNLPDDQAEQDQVLDRVFQENPDSDNILTAVVLQATPGAGTRRACERRSGQK